MGPPLVNVTVKIASDGEILVQGTNAVSYTHLRAHETVLDLVCRLLLEKQTKCHDPMGVPVIL